MKKIFILALLIRLVCLYLFREVVNYDLRSYLQVGELTLKGINIYPDIANLHHPYLPFFLFVELVAIQMGQIGLIRLIGPIGLIKIILILFDLGILYLVYLLSKKNLKTVFLYAVNPVTILVTTLHGQFDVIPVFFILLTIYLLNKKQELLSVLSFSFAILTKTWPALFIAPILRSLTCHSSPRSESRAGSGGNPGHQALDPLLQGDDKYIKWKVLLLILFFPVLFTTLYCIFFKTNPINIGKTLISYQGLWGIWGIWSLLGKQRILWQKLSTSIFLLSFFGYSYFHKDLACRQAGKNLIKNILNLLFFFFVFTTNFSIQYFVWVIPFLIIIKPKKYFLLIILITIYLLSFYSVWIFNFSNKWLIIYQNIIGFILWLSFIKVGYLSRKIS